MRIEPELLPIEDTSTSSTNVALKARLDVSAVGVWSPMERTFLDVRVVHPNCPTNRGKTIEKIYEKNENEKKNSYNQLVIQVEKATFTPLVFTTSGGMAPECTLYHKKVAELISMKTKEDYSHVMSHLRQRLRFTLLKTTLIAIHGEVREGSPSEFERKNKRKFVGTIFQHHPEHAIIRCVNIELFPFTGM